MIRSDVLRTLVPVISDHFVVCNIGLPSQELHMLDDQPTNFYMLGTMGLASSIGLGVALASGGLAGHAQGAQAIADYRIQLDDIAASFIAQVNTAQTSGTTPDGATGQPLLAGADAASLSLVTRDGNALATAPAGASAGSRDTANLQNLRDVLAASGPAGRTDALLFSLSATIDSRNTTRDALGTIAETAATALAAETGVDPVRLAGPAGHQFCALGDARLYQRLDLLPLLPAYNRAHMRTFLARVSDDDFSRHFEP